VANLNDIKTAAFQKILIYGPAKTGKSALAGTVAEFFNVTYNDGEDGVKTLKQLPEDWRKRIDVSQYPDTAEYPIFVESVLKILKGGAVEICDRHGKGDCMLCKANKAPGVKQHVNAADPNRVYVIDSMTQFRASAIWKRYASAYKGKEPEDVKFEWDDWHWLKYVNEKFGSYVQAARGHIIVITHEEMVEMEDKRKQIVPVAGTENTNKTFARYFDHVIYTTKRNNRVSYLSKATSTNEATSGSRVSFSLEDMPQETLSLAPFIDASLLDKPRLGMSAYDFMKAEKELRNKEKGK